MWLLSAKVLLILPLAPSGAACLSRSRKPLGPDFPRGASLCATEIKRFGNRLPGSSRRSEGHPARADLACVASKASNPMDDLLREFLTETAESLEAVDRELVRFEQEPNDGKILDNIFRLVHTIKGTCGFLGLPRLGAITHAAETLLGNSEPERPSPPKQSL